VVRESHFDVDFRGECPGGEFLITVAAEVDGGCTTTDAYDRQEIARRRQITNKRIRSQVNPSRLSQIRLAAAHYWLSTGHYFDVPRRRHRNGIL